MAEQAKKDNKNLIIGICTALAVIIIAVVAIIFANKGPVTVNDSYFVSDDSKLVLNLNRDFLNEDEPYTPLMSRLVYSYSGDKITGLTIYYEYADATAAQSAYDYLKEADALSAFKNATVDGKYITFEAEASEYENLTVQDVKDQIEFVELFNTSNEETYDETYDEGEEEVEEPDEEV